MKRGQPTHDQFRTDLVYEMFFPVLILGTVFLVGWGCWAYLGFHWLIGLLFGLVSGVGAGSFIVVVAIRELEKAEGESMTDMEPPRSAEEFKPV